MIMLRIMLIILHRTFAIKVNATILSTCACNPLLLINQEAPALVLMIASINPNAWSKEIVANRLIRIKNQHLHGTGLRW